MQVIKDSHLSHVCRLGNGKRCCSFLMSPDGGFTYHCAKENDYYHLAIESMRQRRQTWAMGNNCTGPPEFEPRNYN